jgi:hypothetical protein
VEYDKALQIGPYLARVTVTGEASPELNPSTFERRFAPFVCNDPHLLDEEDVAVCLASAGGTWPRPGRPKNVALKAVNEGHGNWRVCRNDIDAALTASIYVVEGEVAPSGMAVDACLHIVLWLLMTTDQAAAPGIMVHAATTVHDGEAYLFFGPAGAGKSTLVEHSPSQLALCDDLSLLTKTDDGSWHAWPSPFWDWEGEFGSTADPKKSYPVRAIAFLEQGPATRLTPTSADEGLTQLMEHVYTYDAFIQGSGRTFELVADLLQTTRRRGDVGMLHLARGDDPYQAFAPDYSRAVFALRRPGT